MLEDISGVTEYLQRYGGLLAEKIQNEAEPLFNPGESWEPKVDKLLRDPFPAQGDTIMGIARVLENKRSAVVIGEMGCGKSLIGAAIPYISTNGKGHPRTLVMCPGHLVKKWAREIRDTVPGAETYILRKLSDVMAIDTTLRPVNPEYYIVSKDRAKLGYAWTPAVVKRKARQGLFCPDCGSLLLDKDGVPLTSGYFKRVKRSCNSCGSALWQADNSRLRRFAISEYIKKYLRGFLDYAIFDEVHELKAGSSAQGNSFGALASAAKKSIALTGTFSGGYADDNFFILQRLSPATMKADGFQYKAVTNWMARYGVLEYVTKHYPSDDNVCSKGKKGRTIAKRRPGISPQVFSRHLMDKCVFLNLEDIALKLPAFNEEVVEVRMDEELAEAYYQLEDEIVSAMKAALQQGSKALLATYLQTLLSYPDRPFGNQPILDPRNPERVIAIPPELSQYKTYSKERELAKLVKRELEQNRRAFVFCEYTGTKDVTGRLSEILEREDVKVAVLKASVPPEKREEWVLGKVKEGYQCIIANPRLCSTGLDLLDFPTLCFFQCGYSIFTLRQASRRSWRIGQDKEVKVYYMYYQGTLAEKALTLIGSKLNASLAIEGKLTDEGLIQMTQGEDMTTALAKALVNGMDNVEGAEQIWKKLNEKNQRNPEPVVVEAEEVEALPVDEAPVETEPAEKDESSESNLVVVDLVTYKGRRKKVEKKTLTKEELGKLVEETNEPVSVQLAMF